jgi:hypothetical protein
MSLVGQVHSNIGPPTPIAEPGAQQASSAKKARFHATLRNAQTRGRFLGGQIFDLSQSKNCAKLFRQCRDRGSDPFFHFPADGLLFGVTDTRSKELDQVPVPSNRTWCVERIPGNASPDTREGLIYSDAGEPCDHR